MKKPIFKHCNTVYTVSWILTVPLLINICTGCNLFSFWVSWLLFILILALSSVRLVFGFKQHCYKFSWGLLAQLLAGALILAFFQLSFNKVIKTPVSDPVTPAKLTIAPPKIIEPSDTISSKKSKTSEHKETKPSESEKKKSPWRPENRHLPDHR